MAGLTPNGFEKKNLDTIKTEIEDAFRTAFGFFINLLPASVFATFIGIFADRESSIWDLMEEVYNAAYPDTADGVNLDNAVRYTGITRLGATKSRVPNVRLFGDLGTTIPQGTQFSVEGNPNAKFVTMNDVTLIAGTNEVQEIDFGNTPVAGDFKLRFRGQTTTAFPYNASAQNIEDALNALSTLSGAIVTGDFSAGFEVEFGGDDGLQDQPLISVVDNTLEDGSMDLVDTSVTVVTPGEDQGAVDSEAVDFGPVDAPLYTLTIIDTPVAGLNRIINTESVVIGRNMETDAELKLRRVNTLNIGGKATVDAIRAALLNIVGVSGATVFENDTMSVDGDGRPPKSFEAVVQGGDDQEIAQTIWNTKPAGIQAYGDQTENATDSQGNPRPISFSRAGEVLIYFSLDLTVDPVLFPVNGAALAEANVIEWGNRLGIGADVIIYPQLIAQLNPIPGILDVRVRIDDSPVSTTPNDPAVDDNIIVPATDIARFDSTRGQVNIL